MGYVQIDTDKIANYLVDRNNASWNWNANKLKDELQTSMNKSRMLKDMIRDTYWNWTARPYNRESDIINRVRDTLDMIAKAENRGPRYHFTKENAEDFIEQIALLMENETLRGWTPIKQMYEGINSKQ